MFPEGFLCLSRSQRVETLCLEVEFEMTEGTARCICTGIGAQERTFAKLSAVPTASLNPDRAFRWAKNLQLKAGFCQTI